VNASIACQLGVFSPEERIRYAALSAQIDAAVVKIVEMPNGFVLHLPGDDTMLALVSEWIALERRCCPFFEFTLSLGGSNSSIRLALTGSPEVKEFLRAELRSRVVPPSTLLRRRAY